MFPVFLCLPFRRLSCVYLVTTLLLFSLPVSVSTVQSGPQPNSIVEAFCLRQSRRRAVVECRAHGPGQIELNALPGSEETQLLWRETGYVWIHVPKQPLVSKGPDQCTLSLSGYQLGYNRCLCLLRHNKMIFIVSDSCLLKLSLCALSWKSIQTKRRISLQNWHFICAYFR